MVIYIYGTGGGAEKLFVNKIKHNIEVKGFIDSASSKWGKKLDFAPEYCTIGMKGIEEPYDLIVIASVHEEIYYNLIENNIPDNKILILNEHAYNRIQNKHNDGRYTNIKNLLQEQYLNEFPLVKNIYSQGSYSSSIVDINYIKENESKIFKIDLPEESGIDLHMENQMELLHQFSEAGDILDFSDEKQDKLRFHGNNGMFLTPSAHILSHIILTFHTKKIIEAGSGFSSAAMLDVNEKVLENRLELTFIEPYPERLKSILKPTDNINLLERKLQEIDLDIFRRLESGDILFIDSSHVSKTGSDVNYVVFEILPTLQSGVIVHFHDVFFPFEYSKEWIYQGRGWTEDYLLRAFLQYNSEFEILYWEDSISNYVELGKVSLRNNDDRKLLGGGCLFIRKK